MTTVTSNLRLMLQRPPRQQYAALCYRIKKKQGPMEILVATSRDTGRWIIPKGWPMANKRAHQVAEREAYEEVGVKGRIEKEPLGHYNYRKTLGNGLKIPVLVQVHVLQVDECLKSFPEKGSRTVEWVSCEEAATRVNEPELKALLLRFAETMNPDIGQQPIQAAS